APPMRGGSLARLSAPPHQTPPPVRAGSAQLCTPPAAIAEAVPAVPSTEGGGVVSPLTSTPQQTTAPVPAWIAQLWPMGAQLKIQNSAPPAAIAEAVPAVPSTEGGAAALPTGSSPPHATPPVPASMRRPP